MDRSGARMRLLPARVVPLCMGAALLAGCDARGGPTGTPVAVEAPPPEIEEPEEDSGAGVYDGLELPPFEPLPVPPPELTPPMLTPVPEAAKPREAAEPSPEAGPPAPAASLESLLRVPGPKPATTPRRSTISSDAESPSQPSGAAAEPGRLDRLRKSVHVERRSEPIGPKGPRQGTRSETDAGIRVPVDDAVSVEGGVRVDQREEPGLPEAERKSTPRVGVEVRF